MNNFELIDDYLTDRLNDEDKKAFEQQLSSDPSLKSAVEFQQQVILGVKAARAAELKAMLNNVPVAATKFYLSPMRMAAGLVGTAVIATALYFYFSAPEVNPVVTPPSKTDSASQEIQNKIDSEKVEQIAPSNQIEIKKINPYVEQSPTKTENITKEKTEEIKKETQSLPPVSRGESKPAIELVDPTDELSNNDPLPAKSGANPASISIAKIDVDVISTERKYKSHYQFTNGRLVLYGNFDNSLYEIIEVNGENTRSLFLYYQSTYFLLNEKQNEVTMLKEISDPVLIQKLKDFRSH